MAGLLSGVLPAVFSAGNKLKRQIGGLLSDPVGTVQQQVGLLNDKAGAFNQLTAQAAQEHVNSLKTGGGMGQAQMKLANTLADSYNPMGMVVWHGSPHKFTKFDSSKIGTGEGAQAYGHVLYFAESDRVAKQYADTLTDKAPKYLDGVPVDQLSTAQKSALGLLSEAGGNANAALLAAKTDMARAGGAGAKFHVERYNTLRDIAKGKIKAQVGEPSLYKVDLPDDAIAKMLDWDKPLSQQAPEVKALIKKTKGMLPPNAMDDLGGDMSLLYGPDLTGADFLGTMNSLQPNFGETALQRVGVPGVRYLDGGSRGAGSGTSNFVVFPGNEGLLTILERNGQPLK